MLVRLNENAKNFFINEYDRIGLLLNDLIKKSFIDYYGKEYEFKINNIFSKIKIIFISENFEKNTIYTRMNNIYIENNDTDNLDYFSLLKLGFYNILIQRKKNDENKKIIIAHSDNCNGYCEYDEWIEKNLTSNGASIQNSVEPVIYIEVGNDGKINLHGLIHEINHLLMKEGLCYDENGNFYNISGIYENKNEKMFNEIINEYISKRIIDNIGSKLVSEYKFIKNDFGSWYVDLDKLNGNLIYQIFIFLEDLIKKSVISGDSILIKRILNDNAIKAFDYINKTYKDLFSELYIPGKRKEIIEEKSKDIDKEKIRNRNEYIIEEIKKSYDNYLIYNNQIDDYVDELAKNGNAVKINS